jgi:hypothetical protein
MGFKITISDVFLTILSFKIPVNQNNFSVFNRSPSVTTLNPDVESSQFEFAPCPRSLKILLGTFTLPKKVAVPRRSI